jgi:hypothetical protein
MRSKSTPTPIGQGVRVGESRVNFPVNFAARRCRDSVYDLFVARKIRVHTDAKLEWRRQQQGALGTRPVPARRGCQRVGRKRRFADTGVAAHTSRISIVSEIAREARNTIPTKRNSVVISIARRTCKMSEWVLKTLRKF